MIGAQTILLVALLGATPPRPTLGMPERPQAAPASATSAVLLSEVGADLSDARQTGSTSDRASAVLLVQDISPLAMVPARLEQLGWMTGHWEGEGLGGRSFETISPAVAGQMSGHFQQLSAEGLQFYEFYQIVEVGGSLILRIRHFRPDLVSWEQDNRPVEFPLTAISSGAADFGGVTFRQTGPDSMLAEVEVRSARQSRRITFTFRRAPAVTNGATP